MERYTVYCLNEEAPVRWAAAELKKYLARATETAVEVCEHAPAPGDPAGFQVGTFAAFPERVQAHTAANPFDDEIFLSAGDGSAVIAGINPRSVVLAVYRYLTELGCRWVRPGADGEFIPKISDPLATPVAIQEAPSYRHRGLCIEGAVSYEHVRDVIDWLPKVGMNAYFVQFREAYEFFARWYQHQNNPLLPKEAFTVEDARRCKRGIWDELKKRGMLLHMVGHGWTCEPFGVSGLGWMAYDQQIPDSYWPFVAEVNGKRELWGGVPLNTNLCYGNPEARATMARAVADYAEQNPEVDIIHLWLADGSNNHCECPLCRDHQPADLYVKLCNEVDGELTRRGLSAKIVFLIYVDLLWPPVEERLVNPDRFILMFAPITRSYTSSFTSGAKGEGKIPPYRRNKLQFPSAPVDNLAFLRGWQQMFQGDSFDFDYHLMWDHYKDPGYYHAAEVLCEDIRGLRDIGLNGFNSCQVQRSFFPTGLMMVTMARELWNRELPFDTIAEDYYRSAFGADGAQVKEYCRTLSELFDPPFLRGERDAAGRLETARKLDQAPDAVRRFLPVIEAHQDLPDPCQAKSWRYLRVHADICLALAPALAALAREDKEGARQGARAVMELVRRSEAEIHPVLDASLFIRTICGALGLTPQEMEQ